MPPRRRRIGGPALPAVALLILAGACFARLIAEPSGLIVDPDRPSIDYANRGDPRPVGNDLVFLFLPHHATIADRIERFGHLPAWDARGFGGRPMVGNPQAGIAYPPAWLAWALRTPSALGWLTIAHLIGGGLGVYVLLRSMGAGRWAATVAGGIYQASPYLMAHVFEGHYPHVWAACWYPWAFWAQREHRDGRARGLLLAPILAATYLTGHPQEWLMLVAALGCWAVVDAVRERRPRRLAAWLGLVSISIAMAGVDVGPQTMVRPWLRRNHDPHLDGMPHRYHLGGLNAFQLLSPHALGGPADYFGDDNYWESVLSIGLVPLVLAAIGVLRHPERRAVRGWLALTLLALAFAGGRALGIYPLCHSLIPGFGMIRVPARSLFLANLAGAVLAGLGMETLRGRLSGVDAWRRLARRVGIAGIVAVVVMFAIERGRAGTPHPPRPRIAAGLDAPAHPPALGRTARAAAHVLGDPRFWSAIGGTAVLLLAGCRPIGDRRGIVAMIGLLAMGELAAYGFALVRVAPASRFMGADPVSAAIERLGGNSLGPAVRIKARDAFYGDLAAQVHGIEKTNVDDAFQLDRPSILYETLYPVASHVRPMAERRMSPEMKETARRIRQAVFDRMGVALLVSDRVETDPAWPVAAEGTWNGSRFVIQRNASAMPRAYVVPRATVLPDHPSVVLSAMAGLDPRQSVIMTADTLPSGPRQSFAAAEWLATDPDRPSVAVTTRAPGLLVMAETWMPGWSATLDGRPVPVLRGNYAQRVVALPEPGRHVIAMRYDPPGLRLGCGISIASGLAWAWMVVVAVGRRARTGAGPISVLRGPIGRRRPNPAVRHPICRDSGGYGPQTDRRGASAAGGG